MKPPETFAALLDQPAPVRTAGDPLPPLWHWFFFDTIHPQATLGQDGHPANASFTPPLPHRRRMFGGGRLTVHQPLRCGDQVQRRSSLGSVRVRHGSTGWLLLVTVRHEFLVGGQLRVLEEQDLVYRDADDLRSGPTAPPEMTEPAERGPWQLRVRPDPVLLFRFSARSPTTPIGSTTTSRTRPRSRAIRGWSCTARCWRCCCWSCRGERLRIVRSGISAGGPVGAVRPPVGHGQRWLGR